MLVELITAATLSYIAYELGRHRGRQQADDDGEPHRAKLREFPEFRTAVHEAGHAVCAWVSPHTTSINSITINGGGPYNGGQMLYTLTDNGSPTVAWHTLTVHLGGIAAELLEFGKVVSKPAKKDLTEAAEAARMIVGHGMPNPPWSEPVVLPAKYFDVSEMFRSIDSDTNVAAVLNLSLARAKHVLTEDRERMLRVADELVVRRTLDPVDIRRLFGRRFRWPGR